MSQQQRRIESTDRDQQMPTSADGWAAQLAADRNNYQKGTHQKQYQHDMSMAQSYVDRNFGQVQITGTQDGHLVGFDRQSKNYVSLNDDAKVAIGSPSDGQWQQTGSDHMASFNVDGSGNYRVGQQDRSGEDVARSILKDRANGVDPSETQVANFQRDLLLANGRKPSDKDWFRHLKPGQTIKVPAGEQTTPTADSPNYPPTANSPYYPAPDVAPSTQLEPGKGPYMVDSTNLAQPTALSLTDAPTAERQTKNLVDQQNKDMDSAYGFLKDHVRGPLTSTTIENAMDLPGATEPQKLGLLLLNENLISAGNADSGMTYDQLDTFKAKQEQQTWLQAGKDSPALANLMKSARNAYDHFADSFGIGPLAHKYLTSDKINAALKNGGFSDDMNGLGFLQRHLKAMTAGSSDPSLYQEQLNSWTLLD